MEDRKTITPYKVTDEQGRRISKRLTYANDKIVLEKSIWYSAQLIGSMTDDEIKEFEKDNEKTLTQHDKIMLDVFYDAIHSEGDAKHDARKLIIDINKALLGAKNKNQVTFIAPQQSKGISDFIDLIMDDEDETVKTVTAVAAEETVSAP